MSGPSGVESTTKPTRSDLGKTVGSKLVHNGYVLDLTHTFAWRAGFIFCSKWEHFSIHREMNLRKPCPLKPHWKARERLNDILGGFHPVTRKRLPSHEEDVPPPYLRSSLSTCKCCMQLCCCGAVGRGLSFRG